MLTFAQKYIDVESCKKGFAKNLLLNIDKNTAVYRLKSGGILLKMEKCILGVIKNIDFTRGWWSVQNIKTLCAKGIKDNPQKRLAKEMKKKILAALLAGAMTVTLGACGGNTDSGNDTGTANDNTQGTTDTANVSGDAIRFMNTKIEIDGALKEFAKQYQEETGQEVVHSPLGGGVDVNGQLKNYYAAGNMPDIFGFAADSYKSSFKDWLEPLDGESWIEDTDYAFKGEDGKVYGMPFALEGIGIAYNKDILDQAGIDPSTLTNINAYKDAFEKIDGMKDELGITSVCAVAAESDQQMYWSTGNHMMAAYISQGKDRTDKDIY